MKKKKKKKSNAKAAPITMESAALLIAEVLSKHKVPIHISLAACMALIVSIQYKMMIEPKLPVMCCEPPVAKKKAKKKC